MPYNVTSCLPSSTVGPCRAVMGCEGGSPHTPSSPSAASTARGSVQPECIPQQGGVLSKSKMKNNYGVDIVNVMV